MNRFNLTFTGEILPGYDPKRVRVAFGKLFQIKEPARVEQFFAGEPITLRRNLDRKTAADLYAKLHKMGADVALEKVAAPEPDAQTDIFSPAQAPSPTAEPEASNALENRGMNHEIRETHPGLIDQSWPVSTARIGQKSRSKKAQTAEAQQQADLIHALQDLLRRLESGGALSTRFRVVGETRALPAEVESELLRIAQEGMINALKHAKAKQLELKLEFGADAISLSISDNGVGFDPSEHHDGFGLLGMRERAERIGAELRVSSRSPLGTRVETILPRTTLNRV